MPEAIQSVDSTNEAQQRVQDAMEEAFQLVSALECEMKAHVPLYFFEKYQQESIETFACFLAAINASDNEAVQEIVSKQTKQPDGVELAQRLNLDALYIWKAMEMKIKQNEEREMTVIENEKLEEQFVRTSAHHIDELLIKLTSSAPLGMSFPQIIDDDE